MYVPIPCQLSVQGIDVEYLRVMGIGIFDQI